MKGFVFCLPLLFLSCASDVASSGNHWVVGKYISSISHVPGVAGYTPLKSEGVEFRKYKLTHPAGIWTVVLDAGEPPIEIRTAKGNVTKLAGEWYPEEGGADSAVVYGFVKGNETLIVLQGTSDLTYEETWIRFDGETKADVKRYAAKGGGMGPEAPGIEPKYRVYPTP